MNKNLNQVLKATVILLMFFSTENTAQTVILVNGVPTKVILDGEEIKNIVQQQVADYMEEYGQEPDDTFTKSVVNFNPIKEADAEVDIKATAALTEKRHNSRKKDK